MARFYTKSAVSLFFLLLAQQQISAQQATSCLTREITVSVVDRDGEAVSGLDATNFQVILRKESLQVLTIESKQRPHRLAILLDTSGSMFGTKDRWLLTQMVAEHIVDSAPRNAEVGLAMFESDVRTPLDFSKSREALRSQIEGVRYKEMQSRKGIHKTGLLDSMLQISGQAFLSPGDVLYVITDGEDNVSKAAMREVQDELLAKGIRLFLLLLPAEYPVVGSSYAGPDDFQDLSETSGGSTANIFTYGLFPNSPAEITSMLQRFYRLMFDSYTLKIQVATEVQKPEKWKIKIVGTDKKRDFRPLYPQKLVPCLQRPNRP